MKTRFISIIFFALVAIIITGCSKGNDDFTKKTYSLPIEKIKEICIDVRDRQIEVVPSSDQEIHIDYYESEKEFYDISITNENILNMSAVNDKDLLDFVGSKPKAENRTIYVQIPNEDLSSLNLSTTNEKILLSPLTIKENITLASNGGNIEFSNLQAGNSISLKTKNADISGTIVGNYDDYKIECKIKKGKNSLPVKKENGTKSLNVSNNNGDIDIEFAK